jgi:hypothetical protein
MACVEAPLSNGQTVEQPAVGWVTAAISGLALVSSALLSGMGHSLTAAHIAANALTLFSYFQAQAMFAMMAVPLPPLAIAWTQNFDWAVGIINLGFMQDIFHWYVQATGGTPANLFRQRETVSVQIAKRSMEPFSDFRAARYGFSGLSKRSNNDVITESQELVRVTGITRMSYKAHIESTNFFLTGMSFFVAFICLVMLLVGGFRVACKSKWVKKGGRFPEFRAKWLAVLKGIMYRVVLIGFPQMVLPPSPLVLAQRVLTNAGRHMPVGMDPDRLPRRRRPRRLLLPGDARHPRLGLLQNLDYSPQGHRHGDKPRILALRRSREA